jgi:hypothetical protein
MSRRRAFQAGLAYFAVVFAVAFVVGVGRVLLVAPRLGDTGAVLLELPIILVVSWWTCGQLLTRFTVGPGPGDRLTMGLVAFVVLQAAEVLLAVTAFARTPSDYLDDFASPAGLLGLAGQIGFALIPLIHRRG